MDHQSEFHQAQRISQAHQRNSENYTKKPLNSNHQAVQKPIRPASRRIPQTLIQSYDLITLNQAKKKKFFNFKKQKQEIKQQIKNPQLQKLKPLFGQCCCAQDIKQQFSDVTVYQLTPTLFVLSKVCSLRIKNVTKVKLIGESKNQSQQLKPTIVKITWGQIQKQQEINNIFVRLNTFEQAYFLFSSLIARKLLSQDFALVDLNESSFKSFDGAITNLQGDIFKNSTFMRKWQKRSAKVGEQFVIFKDGKTQRQIKNIKQIWTRFDMHNGYFVVKMFQGIEKLQIGVPLTDFSNVQSQRNWLFLLAKLIR